MSAHDSLSPAPRQRSRIRRDGWTIARQVAFVQALVATGSVTRAASAAGMSREGAYRLRARPGHADFAASWNRAAALRESHSRPAQGHIAKGGRAVISPRENRQTTTTAKSRRTVNCVNLPRPMSSNELDICEKASHATTCR